jgi:transcriptional regulator with XRE-family HTH domain
MESSSADHLIADNLRAARMTRNLTLDGLARRSGVSRAAISKIERGEVSPTAAILARLAAALDISMAALFGDGGGNGPALRRHSEQRVWRDPASDYERRNVSPSAADGVADIVDVHFPAGARVTFDNHAASPSLEQQVWLLAGVMELTVGDAVTTLNAGDCLHMRLDAPTTFHNPGPTPARYAVVLARRGL